MPASIVTASTTVAPRAAMVARRVAGGRRAAPAAPVRRASLAPSVALVRARGSTRGASAVVAAFGNPFAKKPEPEPEPEPELEPEPEPETPAQDGNPFASLGGKVMGALDGDTPDIKLPSLGNLGNPFASGDKPAEPDPDPDPDPETEDAPAAGNPFASFGGFKGVGRTIDETVDLDYGDDESESESDSAPAGNPFAGLLAGIQKPAEKPAETEIPAEKPARKMGNWERTLKEGVKDGDVATWTLDPEPVRGANLRPFKLTTGDVLVIGRDKGPGIDVVAKVGCVSGVHCQLEMEDNRLYVTDLGSTNGTYVDGQEMRKNNRYRVFNGATLRLGAENVNGEPYVSYDVDLTGAKEMDRNSEYGQVQAIVEALGGPKVVVNFLFINVAFQLGFYLLLQIQTN